MLLRMLYFILLLHDLWSDLVISLRNVRSCSCLKMIFGTRPHGHRPRLCSFVTFTPSFLHGLSSQDGVPQKQEAVPLCIPHLNRLIEVSFVWDEISVSNADVTVIPSQHRVTQQIFIHWYPFQDLKLMFVDSHHTEQLSLHSQQCIVSTVEDSVLWTGMTLGQIRSHRRDETLSASL